MKVFYCEQGSDAWFKVRLGVPSASNFNRILTAKTMKLSAQADGYIAELIGEQMSLYTPEGVESYTNRAMRWGLECEAEARRWYEHKHETDVQRVGFCMTDDDRFGCSPDGLIGTDGGLELKCPQPGTHVNYLLAGTLPDDYKWQVHGALVVTGRLWWDFVSYAPGLPPFEVRVVPNEDTKRLAAALDAFHAKYQATLAIIKGGAT